MSEGLPWQIIMQGLPRASETPSLPIPALASRLLIWTARPAFSIPTGSYRLPSILYHALRLDKDSFVVLHWHGFAAGWTESSSSSGVDALPKSCTVLLSSLSDTHLIAAPRRAASKQHLLASTIHLDPFDRQQWLDCSPNLLQFPQRKHQRIS